MFTPAARADWIRAVGRLPGCRPRFGARSMSRDPIPRPGPHDWLASHPGPGQTSPHSWPGTHPGPARRTLCLQPFGPV